MKFSLIVAAVVLALAQGSFAQDAVDLERLGQYFEDMKNKMTHELTELLHNPDLASQAQSIQTQLEPLATQMQEQLKTIATSVEEQIKPMAANVQAQFQPMVEQFQKQMEAMLQSLTDKAKAIGN